ncbi:MAG: glycosyltransferase family 2 protein [Planctomycetaceae bacterium]
MKLSIVFPAHNEAENIRQCVADLRRCISDEQRIPAEYIVVDDNSSDATAEIVLSMAEEDPRVRLIPREPPAGFGRAIRSGVAAVTGDVVVIYMADSSDHPEDVLAYYRKIQEGYDCVYGSRFIKGGSVEHYPPVKLIVNRFVNTCIRWMFWTKFNDLTNAFKAYRTEVIRACGPFNACHFNITLEMSLGALIRRYYIAQIPIGWSGRTWGSSKLRLHEMGRRYLSTLLMMFFQRMLISDDLLADRLALRREATHRQDALEHRVRELETILRDVDAETVGASVGFSIGSRTNSD